MTVFYVLNDRLGTVIAAETALDRAKELSRAALDPDDPDDYVTIDLVDVPVTVDSIRRLLSGEGGYATQYNATAHTVKHPRGKPR